MKFKLRFGTNNISQKFEQECDSIGCETVKEIKKLLKMPDLSPAVIEDKIHINTYDVITELTFKQACKCACFKDKSTFTTYLSCRERFSRLYLDRLITLDRSKVTDGIVNVSISYKFNVNELIEEFIFQGGIYDTVLQKSESNNKFCNTLVKDGGNKWILK